VDVAGTSPATIEVEFQITVAAGESIHCRYCFPAEGGAPQVSVKYDACGIDYSTQAAGIQGIRFTANGLYYLGNGWAWIASSDRCAEMLEMSAD
jgi:hypothetical protein